MDHYLTKRETIEVTIRGRIHYGTGHRDMGFFFHQLLTAPGGVGKSFVLSSVLIPKIKQHNLAPPALLNNK